MIRLGVDIGGTFTDIVLIDDDAGTLTVAKVPSVPADPAAALVAAVRRALERAGASAEHVAMLSHGTTIVTNAVLEDTLPATALVTTAGFRDVLEIGRHLRPDMYDLMQDKPRPLVPRERRFGVRERTAADGALLVPLDADGAREILDAIRASGAQAVAISFLHAYANPANETAMKRAVTAALPGVLVAASSDVCREIREFERTSTVALNAAAMPVVARYLDALRERLAPVLPKTQVLLMQSNGGSMTVGAARQAPAHLVYSGPAAGVLACQFIGRLTGRDNVLGFDMGGTSTDISLVYRGVPRMTTEGGIGGHPVKLPMLDVHTIGAGGGSIAWLDAGDGLHVGPRSAGADPGPAAYGRGGTEPTVTDANLVLGRLAPDRFLGGEMRLDRDRALAAITERVAHPLGLDPVRAAWGIVRIANANMERALRVSSAERGYDPRDFTLVAFGGAGPLHAAALAAPVGFPWVLVPETPGVFSALGLLVADIRHDLVQSFLARTDDVPPARVEALFADLERVGHELLAEDGVAADRRVLQRSADLRYVGQAYEVHVPMPAGPLDAARLADVTQRFHAEHQRLFAHSAARDPVEIVSVRVAAIAPVVPPALRERPATTTAPKPVTRRPVFFDELDGFADCRVFDRRDLGPGARFAGPAIVEQMDSTTVVHPGQVVIADGWGNLLVAVGGHTPA
ncbi:MAG: hydantoinase/oxoprolinase family protein [Candidatus Rokubacteria bacterium]|nr:hydantoinase/oxoprolinase family protein [Candidatus Rokubacteria bacterium]